MTAQGDWKSLAEEAAMDDECLVKGCTGRLRHRGRHNKRGLLPTERAEVDKLTKKRGKPVQAASIDPPEPEPEPEPSIKDAFEHLGEVTEKAETEKFETDLSQLAKDFESGQPELNQGPEPLPDGRILDPLQRKVEAFYGVGNGTRGRGKVIAYCDAPQILIQYEDGRKEWWRRDLTRDVTCPACNGTGMTP